MEKCTAHLISKHFLILILREFVFPCWSYIYNLLLLIYLVRRISQWVLWALLQLGTTLINLAFLLLLSLLCKCLILRFKIWHYARLNTKYGFLSMKWFMSISVLIYFTFLAFHPCYLYCVGGARFSQLSFSHC